MASNWQCPSCGNFTTIVNSNETEELSGLNRKSKYGDVGLQVLSVSCPNPECLELHVLVRMAKATYYSNSNSVHSLADDFILRTKIHPEADGVDGSRSRHLKCQSVVVIETTTSNRSHPL